MKLKNVQYFIRLTNTWIIMQYINNLKFNPLRFESQTPQCVGKHYQFNNWTLHHLTYLVIHSLTFNNQYDSCNWKYFVQWKKYFQFQYPNKWYGQCPYHLLVYWKVCTDDRWKIQTNVKLEQMDTLQWFPWTGQFWIVVFIH